MKDPIFKPPTTPLTPDEDLSVTERLAKAYHAAPLPNYSLLMSKTLTIMQRIESPTDHGVQPSGNSSSGD